MNKLTEIKACISAVFAIITTHLGTLATPMYILVMLNLIDYTTGLMAAPFREKKINSFDSFRGILKKISMWILVIIGQITDWLVFYSAKTMGIDVNLTSTIAAAVAIWLICNELISLIENISDVGVPMPSFLTTIINKIKNDTNNKK